MTIPPRRPTSTHNSGSGLYDPMLFKAMPDPIGPARAPLVDPAIETVIREHLGRAIHWVQMTTPIVSGFRRPPEDLLMEAPAMKSLLEWVGVLAKAAAREQARKAAELETMAQGIPKNWSVNRETVHRPPGIY